MVTYVKLTCQTKIHGGTGRATTGPGRAQTGPGRAQTGPKSQKTLEGHISLKTCSNAQFGQVLSEIWPPKVFWSQNSCGRA